jgi:hypothetical protein
MQWTKSLSRLGIHSHWNSWYQATMTQHCDAMSTIQTWMERLEYWCCLIQKSKYSGSAPYPPDWWYPFKMIPKYQGEWACIIINNIVYDAVSPQGLFLDTMSLINCHLYWCKVAAVTLEILSMPVILVSHNMFFLISGGLLAGKKTDDKDILYLCIWFLVRRA